MGWVLTGNDEVIDVAAATGSIGTEVQCGRPQPGIIVGKGTLDVPNPSELQQIIAFARNVGGNLRRHANFEGHFSSKRGILAKAMGSNYAADNAGKTQFLQDLGSQIRSGALSPIGVATLGKNQRMAYAYQGRVGPSQLIAIVFPTGEWNTLLSVDAGGKASSLFYQMRFDRSFPFPFLEQRGAGFGRTFR